MQSFNVRHTDKQSNEATAWSFNVRPTNIQGKLCMQLFNVRHTDKQSREAC